MAKFPIDSSTDSQGLVDAVNYALSGPAGLGQNFAGFSAYTPILIRPTGREPFTLPETTTLDANWYLSIPITTIAETPSNPTATVTVTFADPGQFADPPFQFGDILTLTNTVAAGMDPEFYNLRRYVVTTCTTTEVTMAYRNSSQLVNLTWPGQYITGGLLVRDYYDVAVSTDCNGRVTVSGAGDRVFLNAQLILDCFYQRVSLVGEIADSATVAAVTASTADIYDLPIDNLTVGDQISATPGTGSLGFGIVTISSIDPVTNLVVVSTVGAAPGTITNVLAPSVPANFNLTVSINRYRGEPNTEPGSTDYSFTFDGVAAERTWTLTTVATDTNGVIQDLETIFTSVIEQNLPFGYYWYLLDVNFQPNGQTQLGGLLSNYSLTNDTFTPSGTAAALASTTVYTGVFPITVTGLGGGSELAIERFPGPPGQPYSFADNLSVYVINPGFSYNVGDEIRILGIEIGGATPANDLTLIVEAIEPENVKPGQQIAKLRSLTAQVIKE